MFAATSRYYGISRTLFYRWKKRNEDDGLNGLKDRSSATMHCPNVASPDVVGKIVHLRQQIPSIMVSARQARVPATGSG